MNVKRTYGKKRTLADENLLWKKGNDTFDQLFDDTEIIEIPRKKKQKNVRVSFNRDSSLDESKARKVPVKRNKRPRKNAPLKNESHDELYELYLQEKKLKQLVKKKRLALIRKVQISTPVQRSKNKIASLEFKISPIRLDDSVNDSISISEGFIEKIRKQRLKEIEENNKLLGLIGLERLTVTSPLKSSENLQENQNAEVLDATPKFLQTRKTRLSLGRKLSSAEDENSIQNSKSLSLISPHGMQSSFVIPVIEVTLAEDETTLESKKPNDSLSVPEVDDSSQQKPILVTPIIASNTTKPRNTKSVPQPAVRASKRLSNGTPAASDNSAKLPVIQAVAKPPKKTVAINLVPKVSEISYQMTKNISRRSKRTTRSSQRPSEGPKRITLNPGKWRRSLIQLRLIMNPDASIEERRTSRRSMAMIPNNRPTMLALEQSVLLEQSDEGSLHAALSILDSSVKCAATFNDQRKTSQRKTSVFQRSSIFYGLVSPVINANLDVVPISARQIALRRCGQQDPLRFDEVYSESNLPNCCKIGEGVYGEVFMYKCATTHQPIVLKIIPIEGDILVNGEPQKRFDEILQEIVISMELSSMRHGLDFATDGFVNVKRVTCVQGAYPQHLIDEWELFRDNRAEGSDNDHPEVFAYDQHYVVFELCNGGKDLEAFVFNNAEEAQSVFLQTALTLAVAEQKFQFEHRDLHWGNILIAPTTEKYTEFRIDGKVVKLLTHGVKVTIIDYSLSRMVYDGAVLYDNLARDEELFQSTGDYQFDIYRLMRDRLDNDFERYDPYSNLLWLHYIVDKLINGARYRYSKTKKHRAAVNEMMQERDELLNFTSATDYITSLEI